MKCLEKDRTRRYETANGLAADINRFLTNEPVVARPAPTGGGFDGAKRGVGGVAGVWVCLFLGGVGETLGGFRGEKERRRLRAGARKPKRAQQAEQEARRRTTDAEPKRAASSMWPT